MSETRCAECGRLLSRHSLLDLRICDADRERRVQSAIKQLSDSAERSVLESRLRDLR